MSTQPEAAAWRERAVVDLDSAERLAAHGGHPDAVCFHCQQAVEKWLKARIASRDVDPPRTHDLIALARAAGVASTDLGCADSDLSFLTGCYLASRYPDTGATPGTPEDGLRALRIARAALAGSAPTAPPGS